MDSAKPEFQPKQRKTGTWTVVVVTGNGPDSHVGDFATKKEAADWIAANSEDWPARSK
ncbi:hypothetical protein ABIE49_002533 [Bradyrhizobium sp. OAE829]